MSEPITIDIFLEAKNRTKEGVKQAAKSLQEVKKEADGAADAVSEVGESSKKTEKELNGVSESGKKAKNGFDNVEKSSRKAKRGLDDVGKSSKATKRLLKELAQERAMILMEAKDRLTPVLERAGKGIRGLSGKAVSIPLRAIDYVTRPLRGILSLLSNPLMQAGAIMGVSVGLKDTVDTYAGFESAMSQVKAISGVHGLQFEQLTEKAKLMGATTKFTAAESAEAFNYMAMAGWKAEEMLGGIEGILSLAAASGEDLGTTSDIVTDALTAMGYKASDAGHFADVLAQASANANTNVGLMGETFKYVGTMAGSLGYRIEDVALAAGLMANSGLKGSMAGTSLNSILTRLATDTDGAASAVRKLGVEFFNQDGSARELKSVMDGLRLATKGMNDEEKTGLAKKVAGLEAQKGLLAILNASEKDYNDLAAAIEDAKGAAAEMSGTMLDNLSGSITLLQSAADGVKIAFGERLKPYVKGIAVWLTDMMPDIETGLDRFMDSVDADIEKLKGKVKGFTSTQVWRDSGFLGKAHIVWDELIGNPLSDWWESDGRQAAADMARDIGGFVGNGLKSGIMVFLGAGSEGLLEDGMSAGASFVDGFLKGFEPGKIKKVVKEAIKGIFADSYFGGGDSNTSMLSTMLVGAVGLKGLGAGIEIGKGVYDIYSVSKILGGLFKPAGLAAPAVPGVPEAAIPGTQAVAAAGGFSIPVLASVAGGILAAMGLGSSIKDLKRAQSAGLTWDRDRYMRQGLTKGGLVAGGAAAGAAIGSIIPGAGTLAGGLIGGGIGGLTAMVKGNSISELFKSERERAHESLLQMGDDLKMAIDNYNDTAARTDIARGLIDEYQELRDFMNSSDFDSTKAEEVQNRMKTILGDLQDMFPELISGYEKLNGLSDERIAGLDRELAKMDEQESRHLRQTVMDTKGMIPQMMEDYKETAAMLETRQSEWYNIIKYREGLESIQQRYDEALEDGASRERLDALLKQAETLSDQRGFGTSFRGNVLSLDSEIGDSEKLSKRQLAEMDDLIQQQNAMAEQLQTYYDSSVKLIEQDTGINLEEKKKQLDDLREAYNFTSSHHGAMDEDMRKMVEEYLPGFSQAGGAAEKMDALAKGIKDTKEQMQPALQQIKELNDSLGALPEEKKIRIDLMVGGGLYVPSLLGNTEKPSKHARGGFVGAAELSWIGEDGLEAVIPLSGKYRRRGLQLYEQAGRYLGVDHNSEGGIYTSESVSSRKDSVSGGFSASSGGRDLVIQVTAHPETQVHIGPGSSLEEIMEAIRRSWSGITDQMLSEIARKIMLSYENMPGGVT